MKHQIIFDTNKAYYEYGKADRINGIFDTLYLDRTPDATLSYVSGWKSVDIDTIYTHQVTCQTVLNTRY